MPGRPRIHLPDDRYFDPDPRQKDIAQRLYATVANLPLICPHGHVDPHMFADPAYSFGSPVDLFIIPDHYVFRMLYSQGIPLEALGIPRADGGPVEGDHRKIWQLFAENFYLFRGTPTGMWLTHCWQAVFGIQEKLTGDSAADIYEQMLARLQTPEFRPRRLFERFNIEALCTTDAATDRLECHCAIRQSGWPGQVLPTFRPDDVVNLDLPSWHKNLEELSNVSGIDISSYRAFIQALESRRAFFKAMGARATDHGARSGVRMAYTGELSQAEAEAIFQRALKGQASEEDAARFAGHLLLENARMSIEDGLVMQLHTGVFRNHNQPLLERFGYDRGADIPVSAEYTRNLRALLNKYGNHPRLTLVVYNLDESAYSRELAPLAGHYPALKLGAAWWYQDSLGGMARYRQLTLDGAGLYNTAGFADDTRSFPTIPARHDLARRVDANWLAGLVVRGVLDMDDAGEMIQDAAYRLPKKTFHFG
jgi:glucuronate isomerase